MIAEQGELRFSEPKRIHFCIEEALALAILCQLTSCSCHNLEPSFEYKSCISLVAWILRPVETL
jgi:hypothetical protein